MCEQVNGKRRLEAFSAWGDGPDVGINVHDSESGDILDWYDLTVNEAEDLAKELLSAAIKARDMNQSYERHVRREIQGQLSELCGSCAETEREAQHCKASADLISICMENGIMTPVFECPYFRKCEESLDAAA